MIDHLPRPPETDDEWLRYYDLRWRILRAPWHQPHGSEKDTLESVSIHRMICNDDSTLAIGRLHPAGSAKMQIRYMAVDTEFQGQGLGGLILESLEIQAIEFASNTIILHARENAVPFYEHRGYKVIEPSHRLFDQIQHYYMVKSL